ncbi:multiple epidermal growth factor-like domains protein 10 isoform X1 [Mya arenaria]|uniref:multiple epidermal growth factor-like domains protein 10 isoform X1 n=1 Tax=Mya arenaria TaxID=6604 RepID=UPI0022E73AA9|nr:multiple epidermal growth factor-like domains protein 10 isoform X1 [Mya arenaria]
MYCRFQAVLVLYSVVSKGLTFDVTDEPCDACECCRSSKCASATRGEEYHPNVCLDGCLPDYWGLNCTSRCPEHCQECDQTLGCVKCIPGFTGPNCSTQCSRSNCFCNTTKECVSCPTGFHLQGGECLSCRRGCRSCSSYFRCDLCQPGRFGASCDRIVNVTNHCYVREGYYEQYCLSCENGYYNTTSAYNSVCPSACISCESRSNCTSCADGFYGIFCQFKCGAGCRKGSCDKITGFCRCNTNFIGHKCERCVNGKIGRNCNNSCPTHCISCHDSQCLECKRGWYGDQCQNACLKHCTSCHNAHQCPACVQGYHGVQCQYKCEIGCELEQCKQSNGSCSCKPNFIGAKCDQCILGKYGPLCQFDCPHGCLNQCNRNTGRCDKCLPGTFGEKCESLCPGNCNGPCDKKSGSCRNCLGEYTGIHCDQVSPAPANNPCRETCKSNICDPDTGYCKLGCMPNYFGPKCEYVCPINCSSSQLFLRCSDDNRGCDWECVIRVSSAACYEDLHSDTSNQTLDDGQGNIPALATLGAILGVTAVAIIVLGVLKYKRILKTCS